MSSTMGRVAGAYAAVALVAVLALPSIAFGEAAHPAGGAVDVQIWPQEGQTTVIIALDVPEAVKLPAVVRLPVPTGTTVEWAGEILGGDPAADPSRQFKLIKTNDGGQYAEFTLLKSRRAQIDTAGLPLTVNGSTISGRVDWIQSVTASLTTFSVRVPPNAANVNIVPAPEGAPDRNSTGEALYLLVSTPLAQGVKQNVTFSYSMGAAATPATGGSDITGIVIALGVALVITAAILLALVGRQRRASAVPVAPAAEKRPTAPRSRRVDPATVSRELPTPDDDDSPFLTSD